MPDGYLQPMGGQGGGMGGGGNEMDQTREQLHADASENTVPEEWRIQYNPDTFYQYIPTSVTDPWYNPSFIVPSYTDGGEFFFPRRDIGGAPFIPTTIAQTYVGHYYQWIKDPQYADPALKDKYGQRGDFVRGQFYYGIDQKGKPKIVGEKYNAILRPVPPGNPVTVGGPVFLENSRDALLTAEDVDQMPSQNIAALQALGAHPQQLCRSTDESGGRIVVDPQSDNKYLHIPMGLDAQRTENLIKTVGQRSGRSRITLGFPANEFGYLGRGPVINNQPNVHQHIDSQESLYDDNE